MHTREVHGDLSPCAYTSLASRCDRTPPSPDWLESHWDSPYITMNVTLVM